MEKIEIAKVFYDFIMEEWENGLDGDYAAWKLNRDNRILMETKELSPDDCSTHCHTPLCVDTITDCETHWSSCQDSEHHDECACKNP